MSYLRRISTRRLLALCAGVVIRGRRHGRAGARCDRRRSDAAARRPCPRPFTTRSPRRACPASRPASSSPISLLSSGSVQGCRSPPDGRIRPAVGDVRRQAANRAAVRLRPRRQRDRRQRAPLPDLQRRQRHGLQRECSRPTAASPRATHRGKAQTPSLTQIRRELAAVSKHLTVSKATPTDVAGRPAYSVRVSPKSHGGLVGGAQLAWDAVHGTPLDAAVYARGDSSPVLELRATDISFGPVPDSVFAISPSPGTKVTNLGTVQGHPAPHRRACPGHGSRRPSPAGSTSRSAPRRRSRE